MDTATVCAILGTIIGSTLAILGVNIRLISWLRTDMKSFENRIESKLDSWKDEINKEMKDFHGRLCSIEERNKGKC